MIPGSANPLLMPSAAGGYQVQRSLRFNSSDSAYLSRTPAVAGNRKTWTWAGWVKRSELGTLQTLFGVNNGSGNDYFAITLNTSDSLSVTNDATQFINTAQVFRDAAAWMHLVFAVNTANATASDRIILYVNGTRVTSFANTSYPTQNTDLAINSAVEHGIGRVSPGRYFNGYLADVHFIDGQALTPSSFTEVSATTGQLIPKTYSGGSYGTNGFYLQFADNSSNTAATLGKDTSGNSNNWTPNNLSVTAGAGNDSLVDTPTSISATDTGVGGEVRGNYATINPLVKNGSQSTLSNGNLDLVSPNDGNAYGPNLATINLPAQKYYWEATVTTASAAPGNNSFAVGVSTNDETSTNPGNTATATRWAYRADYSAGTVIGIAYDGATGKLWFASGNTWISSGNPSAGTNAYHTVNTALTVFPYFWLRDGAGISLNAGQRAFAYTAPSGFKALCDTNLGAPVVAKPNTLMDVALYTGNNSSLTISGFNLSPDFIWFKARSYAGSHALVDIVRGASKQLNSNLTDAEGTNTAGAGLQSFNSDGFTLGTESNANGSTNGNQTYAAWMWDAGTSTVSNTQGSITSQVRANPTAGFSVVTYTGNGTGGATIGHGLGAAPKLVIFKCRDYTYQWLTYHGSLPNTSLLALDSTAAASSGVPTFLNSTDPSSTVVTLGSTVGVNESSRTYVAYCFAPVVGYSSVSSYVGNGSSDGPFVYTGFRPRWILIKNSSATADWSLFDTARDSYNQALTLLAPNLSAADNVLGSGLDILSNGFKLRRDASPAINASSNTFVYAAFAENPFQYARAR